MTFKREISIDGVAVIIACVFVVSYMVTLKVQQDALKSRVDKVEANETAMQSTESSVASSLAVLTAIVNDSRSEWRQNERNRQP